MMQCKWKACLQAPQIKGQSSPGRLHCGQQRSKAPKQMPHTSPSGVSHAHPATMRALCMRTVPPTLAGTLTAAMLSVPVPRNMTLARAREHHVRQLVFRRMRGYITYVICCMRCMYPSGAGRPQLGEFALPPRPPQTLRSHPRISLLPLLLLVLPLPCQSSRVRSQRYADEKTGGILIVPPSQHSHRSCTARSKRTAHALLLCRPSLRSRCRRKWRWPTAWCPSALIAACPARLAPSQTSSADASTPAPRHSSTASRLRYVFSAHAHYVVARIVPCACAPSRARTRAASLLHVCLQSETLSALAKKDASH